MGIDGPDAPRDGEVLPNLSESSRERGCGLRGAPVSARKGSQDRGGAGGVFGLLFLGKRVTQPRLPGPWRLSESKTPSEVAQTADLEDPALHTHQSPGECAEESACPSLTGGWRSFLPQACVAGSHTKAVMTQEAWVPSCFLRLSASRRQSSVTPGLGYGCWRGRGFRKGDTRRGPHRTACPGSQAIGVHTGTCGGALGGNLLYQTVFHIQISVKGLVIVHDLPASDQKAVTLLQTNKKQVSFLQTEFPDIFGTTSHSRFTTETLRHHLCL